MKVVIIGGVAAGLKAAAKIKRCDPQAQITVLEKGNLISYGACGMPYYVADDVKKIEELMNTPTGVLRDEKFFRNVKGFAVHIHTEAVKIDRKAKEVLAVDTVSGQQQSFAYDKLVIATGASPLKPNLPGSDLANIYTLWHPNDAARVKEALMGGSIKNVVVIGAGLVGMEMAESFSKWQVNVTVVEMKQHIFANFLDEEIALAIEKYVRSKKINILTGETVQAFTGNDSVRQVITDKRTIPADLVIMAVGVKPNVELAREAEITVGTTGAIAVNEYLQTSDPDIYAGGDCVENTNIITGEKAFAPMGSTANKHGRVIGENICGGKVKFRGVLNTLVVRIHDLNAGKVGLTEQEAKELGYDYVSVLVTGHDKPHYMPGAKPISVKLIAEVNSNKVIGAQIYGEGEVAKRIDVIAAVLTLGGTVDDLFDIDLSYAPPFNNPIDNVAVAANVMMNKFAGKFKGISPLEAFQKLADEKVVFLDVRSPQECRQVRLANCKGFKNIPLGQLREKFTELSKDDEIITFCKLSLRGYEAEAILEGEGFKNIRVMEGGILAYPFACETDEQ